MFTADPVLAVVSARGNKHSARHAVKGAMFGGPGELIAEALDVVDTITTSPYAEAFAVLVDPERDADEIAAEAFAADLSRQIVKEG